MSDSLGPNGERAIDPISKRQLVWLGAIVALGLVLRIVGIQSQPLWSDEALTLLIAQHPVPDLFLNPIDPTPGLFYSLHQLLIGPNAGLFAARSISLVAGTLAIVAVYVTARVSQIPALLAALFAALSFPLIDYSQEARAYSLLVLLTIMSGAAFIWWGRSNRLVALFCFMAFALLSFYTHFVAVLWIAPMVVAFLYLAWRNPSIRGHVRLILILMALFAVPESKRLLDYPQEFFSWLTQASTIEALNTVSYVQLPFGLFENAYWQLGPELTAIASLSCYGLLAILAIRHRNKLKQWANRNQAAAIVVMIWLSVPVSVWLFGFITKPIFLPRTILVSVPGFALMLALFLKFENRIITFFVCGLFVMSLAFTGTVRPKENWRMVASYLESNVRSGDVVLLCPAWKAMAFRHAFRTGVDAPLLLIGDGGTWLIEPKLGSSPNWPKEYFELLRQARGGAEAQIAMQNANRIWRISSNCPR